MPRLFLRTVMAGPAGVRYPGVHDFDDATAEALIEGGHAIPEAGSESAAMAPSENAALPRPTRKRA